MDLEGLVLCPALPLFQCSRDVGNSGNSRCIVQVRARSRKVVVRCMYNLVEFCEQNSLTLEGYFCLCIHVINPQWYFVCVCVCVCPGHPHHTATRRSVYTVHRHTPTDSVLCSLQT